MLFELHISGSDAESEVEAIMPEIWGLADRTGERLTRSAPLTPCAAPVHAWSIPVSAQLWW